jgi:hypothetical protein
MAVDHLLGNESGDEDAGFVDPAAFAISAGLSLVVAAFLFGRVVPRARADGPDRAARVGFACSVVSVLPGIGFLWLGLPFVVAGAGVALGLVGLRGSRKRLAMAAVVVGVIVIALGAGLYAATAVSKIS